MKCKCKKNFQESRINPIVRLSKHYYRRSKHEVGQSHKRMGRHFTGGAEKICPENNFFSLIRMEPETSYKSVLYS